MRIFLWSLLISLCCTLAWSFLLDANWDTHSHFELFTQKFAKKYANAEEREKRFKIFKNNLRKIDEFNRNAEARNLDVRQEVNEFTELDYHEFIAKHTGLRGDLKHEIPVRNSTKKSPFLAKVLTQSPPASKNWVAEGKVSPVKNQGSCGACWAFATVSVLESLNAIRGKPLISLSEQQLMDCNYDSSRGNWGCQGGLFPVAFSYVGAQGVMKAADYPYRAQRSTSCRYAQTKTIARTSEYEQITSENYLKTVVGNYGPVAIGIYVSSVFQSYSGGIISDSNCMNKSPNHGVVVVGYGTDRSYDYWMVRNSWGPNWGENGYFRMIRNRNMCNILSMAYFADF